MVHHIDKVGALNVEHLCLCAMALKAVDTPGSLLDDLLQAKEFILAEYHEAPFFIGASGRPVSASAILKPAAFLLRLVII